MLRGLYISDADNNGCPPIPALNLTAFKNFQISKYDSKHLCPSTHGFGSCPWDGHSYFATLEFRKKATVYLNLAQAGVRRGMECRLLKHLDRFLNLITHLFRENKPMYGIRSLVTPNITDGIVDPIASKCPYP